MLSRIVILAAALAAAACGDDSAGKAPCETCDAVSTSEPTHDGGGEVAATADTSTGDLDVGPCDRACPAPTYCDNSEGFSRCRCPLGYDGGECEQCAVGWRQLFDGGACVPNCDRVAACGQGACHDQLGPVTCTCPLGRAGGACESCVAGLTMGDGDRCELAREAVPAGAIVVPYYDGTNYRLARVDPASGALTPIAGRYPTLYGTAIGWDGDTIYLVQAHALERREADSATETTVVDLEPFEGEYGTLVGPALDVAGGRAFVAVVDAIGYANSDSQMLEIDVTTGEVTPLGRMFQLSARAIAWDAASGALWIVSETEVARFDPETAVTTKVFDHQAPLHLQYASSGLAVTDEALVMASGAPDASAWLRLRCGELARRLGTDPAALVVTGKYETSPASATLVSGGRAPSLIVYGAAHTDSQVFAEPIELTVQTTHPDDVVCVFLERQPATVRLAEGSSPRQVIVASNDATVSLTGPATYEPLPGQLITVGTAFATYSESSHFEPAALAMGGLAPRARDSLLFLDRDDGSARWLTLPAITRELPGVTSAP